MVLNGGALEIGGGRGNDLSGDITSNISSHRRIQGMPVILTAASSEITSASALEWDTAPCFLQK